MQFNLNDVKKDEFGRVSGVLALNKPIGITSHDLVDKLRKIYSTRHVGHAGALDPFASGLMIMLVGKATKLSNRYLTEDKEYEATVLLGIKTDSADPEGKILEVSDHELAIPSDEQLEGIWPQFIPQYEQYVPVFSSIKVGGEKLRVLARKYDRFEVVDEDGIRVVKFFSGDSVKTIPLPKHLCQIPSIQLLKSEMLDIQDSEFYQHQAEQVGSKTKFPTLDIRVSCSKGTYIRTLAEDIGAALQPPVPAMLWQLKRTKIGEVTMEQALELADLTNIA